MKLSVLSVLPLILLIFAAVAVVQAGDVPSDACQLLPPAQLAKVLGKTFNAPEKSTAPPPFRENPAGTDCNYKATTSGSVLFRIYVDPSAAVAKETFTKLSNWFAPAKQLTGAWDSAYLDSQHAIHVQKGKVRYYLELAPVGTDAAKAETQLTELAKAIAAQL